MTQILQQIVEALQYGFIQKAIIVGSLIALCSSFLGIFLVLKKYSMIGDGLAHVSFATVAIALFLQASPLFISIPIVVLASFLIIKLNEKANLHGDAAIGLVSSLAIAIGVTISSLSNGFNVDLFSYLFGSILTISPSDVWLSSLLSIVVISAVLYFYNSLFAVTHDEEFARVIGINADSMNYILAALTSITVVLGIRVVGTMLISSLIIFPTVTALQVSRSFKSTIIVSSLVSISCILVGILSSYVFNLPSGATIVLMNGLCFVVAFSIRKFFSLR